MSQFVPDKKFFYRFKSDWGYYLWKGLGAIPGLSFLKPKKVQHEESLTHAQSMLSKIDEKAKEIDKIREAREEKAAKETTHTVPSFPNLQQMAEYEKNRKQNHVEEHDKPNNLAQ